jgi:hypothetical protein
MSGFQFIHNLIVQHQCKEPEGQGNPQDPRIAGSEGALALTAEYDATCNLWDIYTCHTEVSALRLGPHKLARIHKSTTVHGDNDNRIHSIVTSSTEGVRSLKVLSIVTIIK